MALIFLSSILEIFNNNYMPHGACYFWEPGTLWTNVLGDGVTAFSYYLIPGMLIYFVNKRKDVQVNVLLIAFAVFIIACGTVHLLAIVNVWNPYYDISGYLKILMAAVSVGTVVLLWKHMPDLLKIPSPAELQAANDEIRSLNENLEEKVELRTQALQEMNAELESFSYSISHDLQIPIRSVLGYTELLKEDHDAELNEEMTRKLEVISGSATKMNELIQGILEFSRLGRKDIKKTKVDMESLFNESFKTIQELNEDMNNTEFKIESLPSIEADELMLKQVVVNLMSNAFKYAKPDKSLKIEVYAKEDETGITYFVKDNGIGFKEQYKEKIFQVFQRLHHDDTAKGTGVGLAIAHRIILKHLGRIDAKSDENGATFYFWLPKNAMTIS